MNSLVCLIPDSAHQACDASHECDLKSSTGSNRWEPDKSETNVDACVTTVEPPDRPEATHQDSASHSSSKTWPSSPEGIFRFKLQERVHIAKQAKNRQSILQCVKRVAQETQRRIWDFAATSSQVGQHYTIELVLHQESSQNTATFTVDESKAVVLPPSTKLAEDGHQSQSLAGPSARGKNTSPPHASIRKSSATTDGALQLPPRTLLFASQTKLTAEKGGNTSVYYFEVPGGLRGKMRDKQIVLEPSTEPGDCCDVDTVVDLSQAEDPAWQAEADAPFFIATSYQKSIELSSFGEVAAVSCNAGKMSQSTSRCSSLMERRSDCTSTSQQSKNYHEKPRVAGGTYMNVDATPSMETGRNAANIAGISKEPLESAVTKEPHPREDSSMPLVKDTAVDARMRKRCSSEKPSPDHFIGLLDLVRKKQKSTL